MNRLIALLFALALMLPVGKAQAFDFSTLNANSSAAHLVEPDFLGGPNWVGALWDCWNISTNDNLYYPNYWGASAGASVPNYVLGNLGGVPQAVLQIDGIERPVIDGSSGQGFADTSASLNGYLSNLGSFETFPNQASAPGVQIWMDNFNNLNPSKDVVINVKYRGGAPTGQFRFDYIPVDGGDPATAPTIQVDALETAEEDGWSYAAYAFTPECINPDEETITMFFDTADVDIDWIIADTQCNASPVPVPGAVWLLGSGLMGLVGLKRKFRKTA